MNYEWILALRDNKTYEAHRIAAGAAFDIIGAATGKVDPTVSGVASASELGKRIADAEKQKPSGPLEELLLVNLKQGVFTLNNGIEPLSKLELAAVRANI